MLVQQCVGSEVSLLVEHLSPGSPCLSVDICKMGRMVLLAS